MALTKVTNDLQDALAAAQPTITSVGTLTGLTVTGEITANGGIALGDNDELTLGDSDEFKIKHHASGYTHLQNTVGTLYIDSDSVTFRDDDGSPSNMVISQTGIDVTGAVNSTGEIRITNPSATSQLYLYGASGQKANIILNEYGVRAWHVGAGTFTSGNFSISDGSTERMKIDASGNVGIGTSPSAKFQVNQTTVNEVTGFFYNNTATNAACLRILQDSAGSSGPALWVRQDGSGNAITVDDGSDGNTVFSVSQNGALSKASGSFKIDHPLEAKKDTHHLIHSFVEAPQADNIYRGKVDLVDGSATANIDTVSGMSEGTYVLLNTNTQCFTSNESGWTAVKGSVSGNILTITAQESCTDTISWMVVGERHDQHMLDTEWTDENGKVIVEPLKEVESEEEAV